MTERQYAFWLGNVEGLGAIRINKLMEHFASAEEIYKAKKKDLLKINGFGDKLVESIFLSKNEDVIIREYEQLAIKGINMVLRFEDKYPKKLKYIFDAPYILYYKGELPKEDISTIAIIGARNCSNYGKEIAEYFAGELSKYGVQVISGLAAGIDTYAHIGVLKKGGKTYGVLGCGVDICYPKNNINIFMNMIENGGVISEYKPGTLPIAGNFPMRNRIISGMSDGILVVEAREKSGSLITVDLGLEQGTNIYAVPGRIDDKLSTGCNNLIKMGAIPVTNIDDILSELSGEFYTKNNDISMEEKSEKIIKNKIVLETTTKIVYACLRLEPKHIEDIILETGLELTDTIQALFELEGCNLAVQTSNNFYARKKDIW